MLSAEYKYNKLDDDFLINHNYKNWKELKFQEIERRLMESMFEDKGVYNVCFAFSSKIKHSNQPTPTEAYRREKLSKQAI